MQVAQYGGHRMPSAFNGGSILDLPVDPRVLARGTYVTYDPRTYRPAPKGKNFVDPKGAQKQDKGTSQQDTKVVLEAFQRILRSSKEPAPFTGMSQARPIR